MTPVGSMVYDAARHGPQLGRVSPATWGVVAVLTLVLAYLVAAGVRRRGWARALLPQASPVRPAPHWEHALAWLLCAAAGVVLVATSIGRFFSFDILTWDINIYAQAFRHAAEGHGFFNGEEQMSHLGSHASPILYLVLPFYLLHRSPATLLAVQGVALALSVLPAWWLSRRHLPPLPAALATVLYAVAPFLLLLTNEFHAVCFAVPLLLLALWAADAGRAGLYLLALTGALLCKESVGLTALFLGGWLLLGRRTRFAGWVTTLLGVLWLVVGAGVIIPTFGGDLSRETLPRFAHLGDGSVAVLLSPVLAPGAFWPQLLSVDSLRYLALLLLPFGFVPLLAPRAMLVALPMILLNLLSQHAPMRSFGFHYEALVLPGLFLAFVHGLRRLDGWLPRGRLGVWRALVAAGLLLCAGAALWVFQARGSVQWPRSDPALVADAEQVLALVPPAVGVAAPRLLQPHLADRELCVGLNGWEGDAWIAANPEIVIVERRWLERDAGDTRLLREELARRPVLLENTTFRVHGRPPRAPKP